jgi:peptidoglycan/LPS O-acetylase OafA/YrhL
VLLVRSRGRSDAVIARVSLALAAAAYLLSLPLGTFVFYFGPSARSAELLVGAALALRFADRGHPQRPGRHGTLAAATALGAVAAYAVLGRDGHELIYRYLGIPVAVVGTVVLIHTGYASQDGPVHRLLGHPWMATIGRHSYSLYLWHIVPFLLLEDAQEHTALPKPVLGLLAVAAAVTLTVLSYRFLERPFLRPRSDVLRPPAQSAAMPSSTNVG